MPDVEPRGPSRRQVLAATIGGALLGSAWGLALSEELATSDDAASVTVAWNPEGFAAVVEHGSCRVLLLDCPDAKLHHGIVEMVTGFLRQRIDILLAPDSTLRNLSTGMRERWKLSRVMAVDPGTDHPQAGLTGRRIVSGSLSITCHRVDVDAWRTDLDPVQGWYLDVRHGSASMLIVPGASVAQHAAPPVGLATTVLVADDALRSLPPAHSGSVLAAPTGAPIFDAPRARKPVRLFRDSPMTFALTGEGVTLPGGR